MSHEAQFVYVVYGDWIGRSGADRLCVDGVAMNPITTHGKAAALMALDLRRKDQPEHIDNASLVAGSPMYYYCVSCGHLADTKAENWAITPPKKLCVECQALKDLGWLE
jgi:hypothetical protein